MWKKVCKVAKQAKVLAITGALLAVPMLAHATAPTEFDLPDLPMEQVYTLGGTVLSGLAVMWGFRKLVKTSNKS